MKIIKRSFTGLLRHKVTLQELVKTSDLQGGYTESWSTRCELWAAVDELSSREAGRYGQVSVSQQMRFRLRAVTGITETMRLLHQGKVYNIRAIIPVGDDRRVIDIIAERGVAP